MCTALIPTPASATVSENLFVNGGFEDGITGWTCPGNDWSTVESESSYKPQEGAYFVWPTEANQENTYIYQDASLADDASISAWAKEGAYFMAANNIIKGVGGNNFAPKNVTPKQAADGYANATREQALIIAVRMIENLND